MLAISPNVRNKLDSFIITKKIPNIIFHGPSGTGKREIVYQFLKKIYGDNKPSMKSNIMFVNCSHGKGIKFIREDLKSFAKTNIQGKVMFKSIVLFNADDLTIDAQSALRRCIEVFSNTRFFIIVDNKHKLLMPILSRFCEIYIPEYIDEITKEPMNLHQYSIQRIIPAKEYYDSRFQTLCDNLKEIPTRHDAFVKLCNHLYDLGYSCLDIMKWLNSSVDFTEKDKAEWNIVFNKIKAEYRCEKLLMLYMFDYVYLRSNKELKNISFI